MNDKMSSETNAINWFEIPATDISRAKTFYENIFETKIMKVVDAPVQRGALIGTFKLGDKTVRITSIHLDWNGRFPQRRKQLEFFKTQLTSPADCEIICGDLNTVGIGTEMVLRNQARKFRNLLGPGFISAYTKIRPTQRYFLQRLDHIFIKGAKVKESHVFRRRGSDHYPLVAALEI